MFASVGSILYGYDLGVIAEAIHSDNFVMQFNPTPSQSGAVVSVFTGGAFFGAMFAGPAGDYIGRKKTIMLGALIFIVGGVVVALAILIELNFGPPWWVHVLLWVPLATFLTIGLLRLSKGLLLALEYRHRAREGRIADE